MSDLVETVSEIINRDPVVARAAIAAVLQSIDAKLAAWRDENPDHVGISWAAGAQAIRDCAYKNGVKL